MSAKYRAPKAGHFVLLMFPQTDSVDGVRMPDQIASERQGSAEVIVRTAFARLDAIALAVAAGTLGAVVLFAATACLLLRGAPPGVQVGPHLGLLAHYLPGYSVTWPGSLIVLAYGFAIGFCAGAAVGVFWNLIHHMYLLALSKAYPFGRTEL